MKRGTYCKQDKIKIPKKTLVTKFTEKGARKQGIEVGVKHCCIKKKNMYSRKSKS
jgi:hypothetical protein